MGRKWYLSWAAAGLLAGLVVSWYLEPSGAAGSAVLIAAGVAAGLFAGFFAAAFVPVRSETYVWTGVSGRSYDYSIHDEYLRFADYQVLPGNFAFVKMADDVCCPLFFGETHDAVEQRFQSHVAWDEAVRLGATHIHWRGNDDEAARLSEVDDLVANYAPPLNAQEPTGTDTRRRTRLSGDRGACADMLARGRVST